MSDDWIEVHIGSQQSLEELAGLLADSVFNGIPFARRPAKLAGDPDFFEMTQDWLCGRFVLSEAGSQRSLRPFLSEDPAPNADNSLYTLCGHITDIIKHRLKIPAHTVYVVNDTAAASGSEWLGKNEPKDRNALLKLYGPSSGRSGEDWVILAGRVCRLEIHDGPNREDSEYIEFHGVEGYRAEYHTAITAPRWSDGYDRLIDLGDTEWLNQVRLALSEHRDDPTGLRHLLIYLDDGPCYEVLCRSFQYRQPVIRDSHSEPPK